MHQVRIEFDLSPRRVDDRRLDRPAAGAHCSAMIEKASNERPTAAYYF